MKTYVIGDIHGQSAALSEIISLAKINLEEDKVILLGDICDGGPDTKGVVDILLTIKNLVWVLGNHDAWFINYLKGKYIIERPVDRWTDEGNWYFQGGKATLQSYKSGAIPKKHKEFWLTKPVPFYKENDMLFVHGGFDESAPIEHQHINILTWDRGMWNRALLYKIPNYKWVFIGHTATESKRPEVRNNVINLDSGAGWKGRLSGYCLEDDKYFISRKVKNE